MQAKEEESGVQIAVLAAELNIYSQICIPCVQLHFSECGMPQQQGVQYTLGNICASDPALSV